MHGGEFLFWFVLSGSLAMRSPQLGGHRLTAGDGCTIPSGSTYTLTAGDGLELLEVRLPA